MSGKNEEIKKSFIHKMLSMRLNNGDEGKALKISFDPTEIQVGSRIGALDCTNLLGNSMAISHDVQSLRKDRRLLPGAIKLSLWEKVNKLAEDNWNKFTADDYTPLQGHLLKYPIKVDADGKVSSMLGHEHFPDVGVAIVQQKQRQ